MVVVANRKSDFENNKATHNDGTSDVNVINIAGATESEVHALACQIEPLIESQPT